MALKELDHVVLLVRDIEHGVATWTRLGLALSHRVNNPDSGVAIAFFIQPDGTFLELVAPTRDDSHYAQMLREHGEGLRLLSFKVDDLDQAVADFAAKGVKLRGVGTDRVFIEPDSASGILVQLWPRDRPHRWKALVSPTA
jgi:methylmalonyl-CoA/ethylmalonyl-CoA epimerase